MSNTKKTLNFFKQGCDVLGVYTCLPLNWACGDYDKRNSCLSTANDSSVGIALVADMGCSLCTCCMRSPCCCAASLVTVPTGVSAMTVWWLFGCMGAAVAGLTDIPATCADGPSTQKMTA